MSDLAIPASPATLDTSSGPAEPARGFETALDLKRGSITAKPELLAPAGDHDCLRAAVENGADAVYFGLERHNARARANNFTVDELPETYEYLHRRAVKGYVTLNTLAFPSELAELEDWIRRLAAAGCDAVIVQDLGLVRLIRGIAPDLPIHASTQMTLTSAEAIRFVEELGVERVILARELSIKEIRRIRSATSMPLESFVHGALCVAYSGQCLTSEALGGRSANRGECAQACRLPYDLICDGALVPMGEVNYLLSPQDLAGYEQIPDLMAAGLSSLKIEGRLKTPEYVANIVAQYRRAIDAAWDGGRAEFTARDVEEMQLSFSRGFSKGWLHGNDHKVLVQGRHPAKRGVLVGEVLDVRRGAVLTRLAGPIKRGDGVVFDRGRPQEPEQGGRIYEVFRGRESLTEPVSTGLVELAFGRDDIDLARVEPGQRLWKTDDPEMTRRLRKTFAPGRIGHRVRLDLRVSARVGEPLVIEARAESGATARVASEQSLEPARKHPASEAQLREQLGRLGETVFELGDLSADLAGAPMIPLSLLGSLRRSMIEELDRSAAGRRSWPVSSEPVLPTLRALLRTQTRAPEAEGRDRPVATGDIIVSPSGSAPTLRVMCRDLAQLDAVLAEPGVEAVYCDFQDIREYGEATKRARAVGRPIHLAPPRIQKPLEGNLFKHLLRHGADGILVRNLGGLLFYGERGVPMSADFSLNAANELTVQLLLERGVERVTPSYDLNHAQLFDLIRATPPERLEVVIHQHMPMFHMEHCVFCAFLSPGTDRTNCGRPCDTHEVKLRDRVGMEHVLKADIGCRNTLFNAVPQSAAEHVPGMLDLGLRAFRIELLEEKGPQVARTIGLYRELLAGKIAPRSVWTELRATNRFGVTRGPLEILN
jgi:putative protease